MTPGRRPPRVLAAAAVVVATWLLALGGVPAQAAISLPSGFEDVPMVTNLPSNSVSVAFAPDGRIFVASTEGAAGSSTW